mmetsp:Transcript_95357/g.269428  ORF Transcript_95357/g.269428 Transcript_95357/m.269428 type:complete len:210 (+) Transcript_95357:381-1010(+)
MKHLWCSAGSPSGSHTQRTGLQDSKRATRRSPGRAREPGSPLSPTCVAPSRKLHELEALVLYWRPLCKRSQQVVVGSSEPAPRRKLARAARSRPYSGRQQLQTRPASRTAPPPPRASPIARQGAPWSLRRAGSTESWTSRRSATSACSPCRDHRGPPPPARAGGRPAGREWQWCPPATTSSGAPGGTAGASRALCLRNPQQHAPGTAGR